MREWDGIEEFVAVAVTGSFQGAARSLRVSTSHVSRAVQRLESRLGLQVMLRTTRKVTLTETGRGLLDPLRRLIQDRDETMAAASGGTIASGELRITCSVGIGERFIFSRARLSLAFFIALMMVPMARPLLQLPSGTAGV
eukprot:gene19349-26402_t